MKQVKVIDNDNAYRFEKETNEFLSQPGITISEIQYSPYGWGYGSRQSVMIIYERQENNDN